MKCYLGKHGVSDSARPLGPCSGQLIRAHLIPQQLLKREGHAAAIVDPRSWVPACGGITGITGHHGAFDTARTLRLPFEALPAGTVALAAELGLTWYLERTYARGAPPGPSGEPDDARSSYVPRSTYRQ